MGMPLAAQRLWLRDVVYLRACVVADDARGNRIDVAGWNAAYTELCGTQANPTHTARSTAGVTARVYPDISYELEAFAMSPAAT
jgi:hypothetical protein